AKPSFGHVALATLMKAGHTKLVWTTNFDPLVADGCAKVFGGTGNLTTVALDAPGIGRETINGERWPAEIKLHGDFRSRRLKNTGDELRQQDATLRDLLVGTCTRSGLVIAGYSGRDESIMNTLEEALEHASPFPSGIFWLHRGEGDPLDRVSSFLSAASEKGVDGGLVRVENFDESLRDLVRLIPDLDTTQLDEFASERSVVSAPPRISGKRGYPHKASVMWRIGLALYAKAGGVPWKLADSDPDTAYIGISYAVRPVESDKPRFVTCCSQVFDGDGAGLEFVAYDANEVDVQRDNPFLSRNEIFRVMTRSLDLYRRRHAGRTPRRVIVHKSTEFKFEEIDGCMEALHLCEAVDLVQIVEDVPWRGAKIDPPRGANRKGAPAGYPVDRGSLLGLGPRECLLWMHGNVAGINNSGSYFQGSRSTPRPIRLVRHAGHGPWDDTARSALALSKMNWNNDGLYDQLPVTMSYAKVLARVVKRMPGLGKAPYQFRFFM
ncbi:MAG: SIR2 family protein, partial [Pseudomonadota bacterium]|nr:SIR2 family protein [Pseudomonadota bacterium]